ncbi:MAG: replicative DNA helicase [Betaproteobacteria bacterium]|nr:replicative DNA helicase [Betaproteobacteria bacterium]
MVQLVIASADASLDSLRTPPHSVEAEQAVLGGLLLDNSAWDKIGDFISEADFYRADHRLLYQYISRLIEGSRPADVITVTEALERSSKLAEAGGLSYLAALAQNTPSAVNIRRYAEIVRDRAVMRQLVGVGTEITESAFNPLGKSAEELINDAEAKVFAISEQGARGRQGFVEIRPLIAQVVERIDQLHANPSDITGIPSGYVDLDRMTSGLQGGDLVIVAGRPSMGKTALALNIAEHLGLVEGLPVAVFSMEMSGTQLVMRMIGSVAKVDQLKVRTGRIADDEWPRLTQAWGRLNEAPIFIDETPALNALELRARARRLHRQVGGPGLGLIVIDYLQLMSASSHGENRATEISEISRSLKALAKELSVPVIALSQLNRSLEQRPNKRPVMSDLRESGAIEQDADLILFIYRDEVYNPDTQDRGIAEIIVGKQRNGPIGTVKLTFQGQYTRFESYADPGRF